MVSKFLIMEDFELGGVTHSTGNTLELEMCTFFGVTWPCKVGWREKFSEGKIKLIDGIT